MILHSRSIRGCRVTVSDGLHSAQSNPIAVRKRPGSDECLLLWGDIHGHTLISDGCGTPEAYYKFARNKAALDVCALTDHDFMISDENWQHSKRVTNDYYEPGRFVTLQGYEWSGLTEFGGDQNVYFLGDDPPLHRCRSYYDSRNQQAYHGPDPGASHILGLLNILHRELTAGEVIIIPHWGGRPASPDWFDPEVHRLIEVFSEHGKLEDWAAEFLRRGYRVGLMASSDDHFSNPGYGHLFYHGPNFPPQQEVGMALTGIYARDRTREAVFEALYSRRVYATTGDRIIVRFDANGHPMGSEFCSDGPLSINVEVAGTDLIESLQFIKNGQTVHELKPSDRFVQESYVDDRITKGETSYYFVRVVQRNNEIAVSSPVWVN